MDVLYIIIAGLSVLSSSYSVKNSELNLTRGIQGIQGPTGPVGPRGPETPEEQGPEGETGRQGPRGYNGTNILGPVGPTGPTGPRGPNTIRECPRIFMSYETAPSGSNLTPASGPNIIDFPERIKNSYGNLLCSQDNATSFTFFAPPASGSGASGASGSTSSLTRFQAFEGRSRQFASDGHIFISVGNPGEFANFSSDRGLNWNPLESFDDQDSYSIIFNGSIFIVATSVGPRGSSDAGQTKLYKIQPKTYQSEQKIQLFSITDPSGLLVPGSNSKTIFGAVQLAALCGGLLWTGKSLVVPIANQILEFSIIGQILTLVSVRTFPEKNILDYIEPTTVSNIAFGFNTFVYVGGSLTDLSSLTSIVSYEVQEQIFVNSTFYNTTNQVISDPLHFSSVIFNGYEFIAVCETGIFNSVNGSQWTLQNLTLVSTTPGNATTLFWTGIACIVIRYNEILEYYKGIYVSAGSSTFLPFYDQLYQFTPMPYPGVESLSHTQDGFIVHEFTMPAVGGIASLAWNYILYSRGRPTDIFHLVLRRKTMPQDIISQISNCSVYADTEPHVFKKDNEIIVENFSYSGNEVVLLYFQAAYQGTGARALEVSLTLNTVQQQWSFQWDPIASVEGALSIYASNPKEPRGVWCPNIWKYRPPLSDIVAYLN
jgi:hypothetical protein